MKKLSSLPINIQLTLLLVSVVVTSLMLTGGILSYVSINAQIRQIKIAQAASAQAASEKINAYFDDLQRKLNFLARVQGLTRFPAEIQRDILDGLIRHNSAYEMVGITDDQGHLMEGISRTDEAIPQEWKDTAAFRRAFQEQEDYVGLAELSDNQTGPSLILAVPVRDEQNKVAGMLFARVDLKFLWSILDETRVGEFGRVYILDQRQYLIARSDGTTRQFTFEDLSKTPIGELALNSGSNSTTYRNMNNELVLATRADILTTNWHLIFELPTTEVYAPLFDLLNVLLISLVFGILVSVALGASLAGYITQPVRALTSAAARLSNGELDTRAVVTGIGLRNELKVLADAFNHMAVQLSDTIGQLQDDIDKRKKTEDALRQSMLQNSAILETAMDGFWVADPHTQRVLEVNDAYCRMSGYDRAELLQISIPQLEALEQPEDVEAHIRLVEKMGADRFETIHRRKDGSTYPLEISVQFLHETGKTFAFMHDITERKLAEEKLRQSEERYRDLFESATLAIFQSTPDGRLLAVNPMYAHMFGYESPEEVLGDIKNVTTDVFADPNRRQEVIRMHLEDPSLTTFENIYRRKNGSTFTGRLKLRTKWDTEGNVLYFEGFIEDITEQRNAENALRESQYRYQLVFENSGTANAIFDTECRLILQNSLSIQSLGRESSEMLGKTALEVFGPERGAIITERMQKVLSSGVSEVFETEFNLSSGVKWFRSIYQPVFDDRQVVVGLQLISQDITERKQAEEKLIEAQRDIQTLFDTLSEGIVLNEIVYDEQGEMVDYRILKVNPAFYALADYQGEDVIGNVATKLYGMSQEEIKAFWKNHMAKNEVQHVEMYSPLNKKSFYISTSPFVDNKFVTSFFDITEWKHTEAKLRESEERYRNIFQSVPISIWEEDFSEVVHMLEGLRTQGVTDFRGYFAEHPEFLSQAVSAVRIVDVNEMTLKFYGARDKEEMLSSLGKFITPESFQDELIAILEGRTYLEKETADVNLRGQIIDLWSTITFFTDTSGSYKALICMINISERKRAEEKLRESEENYRTLFNHLPIPAFTKDIDGVYTSCNEENLKYLMVNPVGRTDADIFPQEVADALRRVDMQVLSSGETLTTEELITSSSAGDRQVLTRKVPLRDRNGVITGILGASIDITERKQAEIHIEEQVKRLNALHTIDTVIKSSFDLHTTLEIVLEQVTSLLKVDAASVLILNKVTLGLERAATRGFQARFTQRLQLGSGESHADRVIMERKIIQVSSFSESGDKFAQKISNAGEKFSTYLGVPLVAKGQIVGVLEIFNRASLTPNDEWSDFLAMLADQTAIAIDNMQLFENLQRSNFELTMAYDATIEGWSHAMDLRDKETQGHTERVTSLTLKLSQYMNIPAAEIIQIRRGALLHDIGKLGVPDHILFKRGNLTEEEWDIMRQHPLYASNMLTPIAYLRPALDIPLYHHEKWDGSGYPYGLKGEQIPLSARIFAVVDVWDALTSDRPYRSAWDYDRVLEHIKSESGRHFDPKVVEIFTDIINDMGTSD